MKFEIPPIRTRDVINSGFEKSEFLDIMRHIDVERKEANERESV